MSFPNELERCDDYPEYNQEPIFVIHEHYDENNNVQQRLFMPDWCEECKSRLFKEVFS